MLFLEERKEKMNIQRIWMITIAVLLVGALAIGAYGSAYAQGGEFNPFNCGGRIRCPYRVEMCNPSTGNTEDVPFMLDPPSNPALTRVLIGLTGVDHSACSDGTGLKNTGKCKLTSIDEEIHLGTPFEARWIGLGSYLRFIKPSGEFNYIATVDVPAGNPYPEKREWVGEFTLRGMVEPGVYTVECFGIGGTIGHGIPGVEVIAH
jgi:hypothetical protein